MLLIARRQCDDVMGEAGGFMDLLFDRQAGPQVVELHVSGGLGEDRKRERIPFGKNLAVSYAFAFGDAEASAINNVVALLFAAFLIDDGDEAGTVHGDGGAAATLDVLH